MIEAYWTFVLLESTPTSPHLRLVWPNIELVWCKSKAVFAQNSVRILVWWKGKVGATN